MPSVIDVDRVDERNLTFQEMLDAIRNEFHRKDNNVDVEKLWEILDNYKSNPKEWSKFAFYDQYRYKRNLVEDDEKYNIMILGWAPGIRSSIHDHSGAHCLVKVLEGEMAESRFAWPESHCRKPIDGSPCTCKEMRLLSRSHLKTNEISYINDQVGLHCVENPNPMKTCASLHIYCPPFGRCKTFDPKTGKSQVCKLIFHSKRGQEIMNEEDSC